MNVSFNRLKGCIEDHVKPSDGPKRGYSNMLLSILPQDSHESIIDNSPGSFLAKKHLVNLSRRLEKFHYDKVSDTTMNLVDSYSKPIVDISLPSLNVMKISDETTDTTSFAMKAINLALVSFIAYMFLKLILR